MNISYKKADGSSGSTQALRACIFIQKFLTHNLALKAARAFSRFGFTGKNADGLSYCAPSVRFRGSGVLEFFGIFFIHDHVEFRTDANIVLKNNVRLNANTILSSNGNAGNIEIGENSYLGPNCVLYSTGGIYIGRDVLVGPGTGIFAETHGTSTDALINLQPVSGKGIRIGDNVWIGAGVNILDGVSIGDNTIIGAGSVVTKSFGADSVIMGIPATLKSTRR